MGFLLVIACAALTIGRASAEVTTRVVDVPNRGVTQRFVHVRPDKPLANVVFLPGHTGDFSFADDGSTPTIVGQCAPLRRTREAFAARGYAVALVDQASDGRIRQYGDILAVVEHLRARDKVPTWIVGGSASTIAALEFAVELPPGEPLGVVVFSPWLPDLSLVARVKRPTLVVYHAADAPVLPRIGPLFDALSAAPVRERVALTGGSGEGCGHHLFAGVEAEFVAAVAGFIDRHSRRN